MPIRNASAWCIALVASSVSSIAVGHHSVAEYDRSVLQELEGEVVAVLWRNPHVSLKLRTQDTNGTEQLWSMEGWAVSMLNNSGVPHDAVAIGDNVRAVGHVSTRREHQMFVTSVLLSNRTEVLLGTGTPHWSGDVMGGEDLEISETQVASARERAEGIFRVWCCSGGPGTGQVAWPEELPLTEAAAAEQSTWDPDTDDTTRRCVPPGMPRAMSHNPFPIEFVREGNTIQLLLQEYDAVRTIHMTGDVPAGQEPTPLGYSVGRFEGRVLIVETTRIDYPLFNRVGVPQGQDVEIVERFSPNDDYSVLEYQVTVTDGDTFTEPVTGTKRWTWQPGVQRQPYECAFFE